MNMLLPILPGTLPNGICFANEQDRLVTFADNLQAILNGQAFFNKGPEVPSVENQGYLWYNTNTDQWYAFSGSWKRLRPLIELDPGYRVLYSGLEADIPNFPSAYGYSGGAAVSTISTGPFFEIDHDFDGRIPMGPGAISGSNPAKTLSVNENFGAGAHTMTQEELAPHSHTPDATLADGFLGHAIAGAPATFNVGGGGDTITMGTTATAGGNEDGAAEPMPIIPPVRGIWFLKPTGRLFLTV